MGVNVNVDPELCIGSTECNRIAAEAFRLDAASGVSVVLPGASDVQQDVLVKAAIGCPTQAIRIVGADGSVIHAEQG